MPYLPPEGFVPYPGSHLYYREQPGAHPETGKPCRWVTYFDPNSGAYHQVPYPLPEPTPQAPSAPRAEPPPQAPPPGPTPGPEQPAGPAPKKKGRGGLIAALVVLLLLVASGLSLWLTGAYAKLPFFSPGGSPAEPGPAQSAVTGRLPEKGTPQRAALLGLAQLFSEQGIHENFMGLGTQELKIAMVDYDRRATTDVNDDLAAMWEELLYSTDSLPIENSYVDLSYSLFTCVMQADVTARLVKEEEERAVVELTGRGRLDLDKVGGWLVGLDYGAPYDDYLADAHGMARSDLGGYYEEGWPRFFLGYWGQALEGRGQEELRTPEA